MRSVQSSARISANESNERSRNPSLPHSNHNVFLNMASSEEKKEILHFN
jgi:hypothetical protein